MPRIERKVRREAIHSKFAWMMLFLIIIVLAARTVSVHIFPDERAVRQARSQYWAHETVSSPRGDVRDRNDIPLAISTPSVSFFVDPKFWHPENAMMLEPYFGKDTADRFTSHIEGRFKWVIRKTPPEIAKTVKELKIPGLYTINESRRMYPHGELASHVIGFCDIDGNGLAGVEKQWDVILNSPSQRRMFVRDGTGSLIDVIGHNTDTMQSASGSIKLTIDSKIQQIVEWKLRQGALETGSKWAAGVCVDPKTGEIIAMASYPWVDLNDRRGFSDPEVLRNNVIGRVYEPGSTFKPIILGIAMEEAKASRGESFSCSGRISIADGVIRDVSPHGHTDLQGLLVKSCNVGMAQLGNRMSAHKTFGMLRQFGFGLKTGVEIAGEEDGILRMPEEWLGTARANIAIGQGLAVTPLQLAMAISSIANGGDLLKPYIISEVRDGNGSLLHKGKRRVRNTVFNKSTCDFLKKAMFFTVDGGTGRAAKVAGVQLAGKTGTAQIASQGQYAKGQYVGSFIGFWPYQDPQYVLLIAMGEPSGAKYYGGQIAAPVFKSIVEDMSLITYASR